MDEETDHYRILGIDDSADEATIKQTVKANYRRLAREHHPDKNPGDKNATARFQKIQHAFDILSNDEKRKEYNEGRAGRRREATDRDAAARQAREAEQQRNRQEQYDRQRRNQEYQRRQEEEQLRQKQERRKEEARRQQGAQRHRDEQRRQEEKHRQDDQQRAWEQRQAREEAERQPDPGVRQSDHHWTRTHWWLLLGFIIACIAWSLRTPTVSAPLHKMVEELRISQSLEEVQTSFTDKYNLPHELQLMEPLVGALINPL